MPQYVLIYSQPLPSRDGGNVVYETRRTAAECIDDNEAMDWACRVVPRQFALLIAEMPYRAVPMVLWRLDADDRRLVWESRPGISLQR